MQNVQLFQGPEDRERVEIFMNQVPEVLPKDTHNATLVSNVHPPDWQNPEPARKYNLVVIGAVRLG